MITIDPITRIEGHLSIKIELESKKVKNAYSIGDMFRGFEYILQGRDPLDAQQITQRICGVCPVSHGTASILAQDQAYNISLPESGRLARNLISGANYIQSHIIHFYHLSAIDFIDILAVEKYQGKDSSLNKLKSWIQSAKSSNSIYPAAPFLPGYRASYIKDTELNILAVKHYIEALKIRAMAHKAGAIFGGKLPHAATLIPGGVTENITALKIESYISILKDILDFINKAYLTDIIEVAKYFPQYMKNGKGCKNFLSYGVFSESNDTKDVFLPSGVILNNQLTTFDHSKINEHTKYSRYKLSGDSSITNSIKPSPKKEGAYSWIKAPRYDGNVMEVGPLARMLVAYKNGKNQDINNLIDNVLKQINGNVEDLISVLGRHAARAIECKIVAERCLEWAQQLKPNQNAFNDFEIPDICSGIGLTEAPRGALGHWLKIKNKKIENYQCIVPTTWNCSPRDDNGNMGAVEQALIGTEVLDKDNPIEATRVVRSFDPCIACAVH